MKIAIIGIGSAGAALIENISNNNASDIKYLSFAQKNTNNIFINNDKVKTINTSRGFRMEW